MTVRKSSSKFGMILLRPVPKLAIDTARGAYDLILALYDKAT